MDFAAIQAKLAEIWAQIEPFFKAIYDYVTSAK